MEWAGTRDRRGPSLVRANDNHFFLLSQNSGEGSDISGSVYYKNPVKCQKEEEEK